MENGTGLVLSGGGAKGAYEAGVYKALCEMGADSGISAVSGTSVGALNAVLTECMGADAEKVWRELSFADMADPDYPRISRMIGSILSGDSSRVNSQFSDLINKGLPFTQNRLSELIDRYIDFGRLSRPVFITCLRVRRKLFAPAERNVEYFHINRLYPWYDDEQKKQIMLASAALPGFFCGTDGVRIKGHEGIFFDGGYSSAGDNTPIAPLYEQGVRRFIAVHLDDVPELSVQERFSSAEILNIVPSEPLGGVITGTLNLNSEKTQHDMDLGYRDTMAMRSDILSLVK